MVVMICSPNEQGRRQVRAMDRSFSWETTIWVTMEHRQLIKTSEWNRLRAPWQMDRNSTYQATLEYSSMDQAEGLIRKGLRAAAWRRNDPSTFVQ